MRPATFITSLLLLLAVVAQAQDSDNVSTGADRPWYAIRNVKLQFAGNQGFLSVGPGISVAKEKLDLDLFFGYVPKSIGESHITSLTLKSTYLPFEVDLGDHTQLKPLTAGIALSYLHGNQYEFRNISGYYWWSSSALVWGFLGGRIDAQLADKGLLHDVGFYYEVGTNQLYLISYLQNTEALGLSDIMSVALGLRFGIR